MWLKQRYLICSSAFMSFWNLALHHPGRIIENNSRTFVSLTVHLSELWFPTTKLHLIVASFWLLFVSLMMLIWFLQFPKNSSVIGQYFRLYHVLACDFYAQWEHNTADPLGVESNYLGFSFDIKWYSKYQLQHRKLLDRVI